MEVKFKQLLNPGADIIRATPGEKSGDYAVMQDTTKLNTDITIEKVSFCLNHVLKKKAASKDGVPLEVLQN